MKSYFSDVVHFLWSRMTLSIWAFFCLSISISGPFATYQSMALPERTFYWTSVITFATVLAGSIKPLVYRLIPQANNLTISVVTAVFFTAIYSPIFWFYSVWTSEGAIKNDFEFGVIAGLVGSTTLVLLVIRHISGLDVTVVPADNETPRAPRLAERLVYVGQSEIYRLSVDDHFVNIFYGAAEQERLRMRLSDAVREMDTIEGFPIHRSHWIAKSALKEVYRRNGRYWAMLLDGTELPVGRTFRDNVAYMINE